MTQAIEFAIVADDLTGANDSGVQFAAKGLKTGVLLNPHSFDTLAYDVIVTDTDSRALDPQEAYDSVFSQVTHLKKMGVERIFKKIDSTLRGNIGAEMDALYDVTLPDFLCIAIAYPTNKRTVKDGKLFLDGLPVGETEIARDPKNAVTESEIAAIISLQSRRESAVITAKMIKDGADWLQTHLLLLKKTGVCYLIFDAETEVELMALLETMKTLPFSTQWVGSAGIASYMPTFYDVDLHDQVPAVKLVTHKPILTIVGSVNRHSRAQLDHLLENSTTYPVAFHSASAVDTPAKKHLEKQRVITEATTALIAHQDVVLYSTATTEAIQLARDIGQHNRFSANAVSEEIVKTMGEICDALLQTDTIGGLVMTGGDTAKKICTISDIHGFELLEELQIGVPIARLMSDSPLYAITKAGGFGSTDVFLQAITKLKGATQQ